MLIELSSDTNSPLPSRSDLKSPAAAVIVVDEEVESGFHTKSESVYT